MSCAIAASSSVQAPVKAEEAWSAMMRFSDLSWATGLIEEVRQEGEGVGMLRKVRLAGSDDWILERLIARDEQAMCFSYVLEGDGMPGLEDYQATGQAIPAESGCVIRWKCSARVDEDQVDAMLDAIQGMAEGMATLFAGQFKV